MKAKGIYFVILAVVILVLVIARPQGLNRIESLAIAGNELPETNDHKDAYRETAERLNNDGIVAFYKWDVTGDKEVEPHYLLCIVSKFKDPDIGSLSKLSIYDGTKGLIYQEDFDPLYTIHSEWKRMDCPPLLILEPNGGRNLEILGYQNGKVNNLFFEVAQSGYEIRPQFRSGDHTGDPFQVIVRSDGLHSPGDKVADVYRYKGGKYQRVGEYSQRKVDDFIEESLSK